MSERRRRARLLALGGLAVDLAFVAIDVATPGWNLPITLLLVAPLLPALGGWLAGTSAVSVATVAVAVVVGASHGRFGTFNELVRLGSFVLVCGLAIAGTRLRGRLDVFAQALDALPDAVTIQGAGGTVLYGNRAALRLGSGGGLDPDAAAAFLARMEVTDEDGAPLDPLRMPAQRLLAGQTAEPVVVRSRDPATADVTWSRVQASPLRDPEGRVRSAVNVIEDITEVKAAERRAAFIAEAASVLGTSLDIEQTLQDTAGLVVPAFADWCAIDLLDPNGRTQLLGIAHADPEKIALGRELRRLQPGGLMDEGGLGAVLRTGTPVLQPALRPDPEAVARPEVRAILEELAFSSVLVAPLRVGPRIIGALSWATAESGRVLGPEDLETAMQLASRAAVAVENARVHTARVEIATVLQDALLPDALPAVPGWTAAAHYRAAGEANEVGGDFYDLVALGDGALLALVGDVAGKGARAAALTALTRHTLVTAATLGDGDASAGLALLNDRLHTASTLELCSVAVLLARGNRLTVLSAGHPLPILLRGGRAFEAGRTSPMLGAAPPGVAWHAEELEVEPGDLLVLHTDGVTDAVGEGRERFGDERLRAALADGDAGAQPAVDRVVAAVEAFERGPQADDRALLALKFG